MNHLDPQHTVFYVIENCIKTYRKYAQEQLSAAVNDITVDQMLLLSVLESNPNLAQNEIADMLFKDHSSITRMIELLVKKDYLSRSINKSDRRKFKLNISAKGVHTLKQLKPIVFQNRKDALRGVSENEVNQLFTTLNKIIQNC